MDLTYTKYLVKVQFFLLSLVYYNEFYKDNLKKIVGTSSYSTK